MRYQGKITKWQDDQGFGFITPSGGGRPVFVHISSFANRRRRPVASTIVTYELESEATGRAMAGNVAFVDDRSRSAPPRAPRGRSILSEVAFIGFVAGACLFAKLLIAILGIYIAASMAAFAAYAWDKSAAKKNKWRTRESSLHVLALMGGWSGALGAQEVLRHKRSKGPFMTVFWVTVVLNCGGLAWLFSSSGAASLRVFLMSP